MTISKEEIKDDFARFIRHEAMRANCTQEEVSDIIIDKRKRVITHRHSYNQAIDDVLDMLHSRTSLNADIPISIVLKHMRK